MHSAEHEDLCLLHSAGELPAGEARRFESESASCPECRELMADLRRAARLAAIAESGPPAGLCERAAAQALGSPRRGRRRAGLALALAAAAIVAVWVPYRAGDETQRWSNGLDSEIASADRELERVYDAVMVGADADDLEDEIGSLETKAEELTGGDL